MDVEPAAPVEPPDADDAYAWDLLLDNIDAGSVVPIVGRDLLTVAEGDGARLLYHVLADRLAESLSVPRTSPVDTEKNPLNAVAAQYILQGREPDDIYRALATITQSRQGLVPPAALDALASIEPFSTFVTTTFDGLLPAAVAAAKGRDPRVASFSARARASAPDGGAPGDEPLVYYLFGRVSSRADYVVTDEDALEFVFQLHEARNQKDHFIHHLSNKSLLMMGCSFPSWFVRFFLRLTRGRRLLIAERDRPAFIVDPGASEDAGLRQFLNDFRTRTFIFSRYSPEAFVVELARRWRERTAGDDREPPMPTGGVFVSYASENRDQARAVVDALTRRGLPAWFDRAELRSGDRWQARITDSIDRAYAFVPIISTAAASSTMRVYLGEWYHGIERSKLIAADDAFLFPIVIDDVDRDSEAIPREIRAAQWSELTNGQISEEFVQRITAAIRRKKIGARR